MPNLESQVGLMWKYNTLASDWLYGLGMVGTQA